MDRTEGVDVNAGDDDVRRRHVAQDGKLDADD